MFSKRLKRLFVTDDDDNDVKVEKVENVKKIKKINTDPKEMDAISNRFNDKYGNGYYEYTYQESVDGIVPCECGEFLEKGGYRSDTKLVAVHTAKDHVDGRCIRCADKNLKEECFEYRQSNRVDILYPEVDILKHTNIIDLAQNLKYGSLKCVCGKEWKVGFDRIPYHNRDSGVLECCRKSITLFNDKYTEALIDKKKQEWESKHGKLNHED